MSGGAAEAWIAEVDERQTHFDAKEQLVAHLFGLEQQPSGRVFVLIDRGPLKGWRRLFGTKRDVRPCFTVEWDAGYASLIFLDDAWSEYRAIDATHPVAPSEEVRRNIAHGELQPHPADQCMEKARAFAAMRDFINKGCRPDWLNYK